MTFVPINDFPGYYISDEGEVKSIKRGSPRILKTYLGSNGRPCLRLYKQGKEYVQYIHKLVAQHFLGPANGLYVRHLDGDILNNKLSNLEYGTQVQNMADARAHGTLAKGERLPQAKLTARKVRVIRGLYRIDFSAQRLSEIFGVSLRTIYRAIKGEAWSHV